MRFHTFICVILGLALSAPVCADEVRKLNKKANKLYSQGKHEEALKLYEEAALLDPSDNKLKMNRGSALYRLNNMEEAENSYLGSLSQTDKKTLADAHYNLGNILYSQGEQIETAGDPQAARAKYSQALENYIQTLKLRPNDADAKWNLQLAHRKVDLLENEQNQNQQSDDDNSDKDDGDDKQNSKSDKNNKDKDEDKNENQDKNDKNQQQDQDKNEQHSEEQQDEQNAQEQNERDIKKEEAERLIELYADDADSLSKPKQNRKARQPEKDW